MEITVFKYKSNEWYQDLFSEFEGNCRKELDIQDSEMNSFLSWVGDENLHCKKELVSLLHKEPSQVLKEWNGTLVEPAYTKGRFA